MSGQGSNLLATSEAGVWRDDIQPLGIQVIIPPTRYLTSTFLCHLSAKWLDFAMLRKCSSLDAYQVRSLAGLNRLESDLSVIVIRLES